MRVSVPCLLGSASATSSHLDPTSSISRAIAHAWMPHHPPCSCQSSPGFSPLANEQVADKEPIFCGHFFNVIIIYRVNIHCSLHRHWVTEYWSLQRQPMLLSRPIPCCHRALGREQTDVAALQLRINQPVRIPASPSPVLSPKARADTPTLSFSMDFGGIARCSAPLKILQ